MILQLSKWRNEKKMGGVENIEGERRISLVKREEERNGE